MDAHYRKIDLQSPADLEFLATNIREVAQKKIDLHIPPSAAPKEGDDTFRTTVNNLVQQVQNPPLSYVVRLISGIAVRQRNAEARTSFDRNQRHGGHAGATQTLAG